MLDVYGEKHIEVQGSDLTQLQKEAGCHKLQRIPPTERNGRVHTSAVTVAILDGTKSQHGHTAICPSELKIEWYSGTGCGGQNRNKVQTSCRLTHLPSGIVRTAQTRSRENSYQQALSNLTASLNSVYENTARAVLSEQKRRQMGTGVNSNLVRTYCFQHGYVKSSTGKTVTTKQFEKGLIDQLWN